MKESIRSVANSTYNTELKLFATAVAIQLSSGGNLADLMDSLAAVIRARMKLNRRVRVLTAQTQLSKRILIVLPILLFVVLNVISPEYMEMFYKTMIGQFMLAGTVGIMFMGSVVMNRLSILRY
jgi:tight adherence protein B